MSAPCDLNRIPDDLRRRILVETGFWENPTSGFTWSLIDPSSCEYYPVRSLAWVSKGFRDLMHTPGTLSEVLLHHHGDIGRTLHVLVWHDERDEAAQLIRGGRCADRIKEPDQWIWESMWMASDGRPDLVELFLDAGFPVNDEFSPMDESETYKMGYETTTALMEAAVSPDNEEVIRLLLDYGADVNYGGEDHNHPPLQLAVEHLHVENVMALLDGGADPNFEIPTDRHIVWDLLSLQTYNDQDLEDKKAIAIALLKKGGTFDLEWAELTMEKVNIYFDPDLPARVDDDDFLGHLLEFAACAGRIDLLDDPRVREMVWMDCTQRAMQHLKLCSSQADARGYTGDVIASLSRLIQENEDDEWF